jgi:hypothetical protein
LFPLASYTFELFSFSWNTIQARAFGRRLPWTALVPFADCLNHNNVQTKYDYHIENNGFFRLFPTGHNRYEEGCEVFNSYGRRDNMNLLLEYGFTMKDNEWEEIDIGFSLKDERYLKYQEEKEKRKSLSQHPPDLQQKEEDSSPLPETGEVSVEPVEADYYYLKQQILSYFGFSVSRSFPFSRFYIPLEVRTGHYYKHSRSRSFHILLLLFFCRFSCPCFRRFPFFALSQLLFH